jgi:hypothetical protein
MKESAQRQGILILAAATPMLLMGASMTTAQIGGAGATRLASTAASPTVTGPVTGGNGAIALQATSFPLSGVGYTQSEFFLSGNASSYAPAAPLGSDGAWKVAPASSAPYTTRIVVDRPANPARFNGTVIVEWLNVSAGLDVAPDWVVAHNELIRDGFAWVGVSAQAVGVSATKAMDPIRYAALAHPGDSYSYDIYSQAGQAVRDAAATILGGLHPRTVLAEGESQSAFRLTTYIDAVQPLVHVYDGFLVHSRAANGAPLSEAPQAAVPTPDVVLFRPDLGVPVLTVETETDVLLLGYLAARQPDSAGFRLWEIAGTAHADDYIANLGAGDDGSGATGVRELARMLVPPNGTPAFSCTEPINTGQMHYIMDTAEYALNLWVTVGVPPAQASRLEVTTAGSTPGFVVDANGNVRGGVRTPAVDVPVATLSGLGQLGTSFCFLFGTTIPFDAAKLAAAYPTHTQFVARWSADATGGVAAGFIRPADAGELIGAAASSGVGG